MISVILALSFVVVLHELGHIIMIIVFNATENRRFFDFYIRINMENLYVAHVKFDKPYKNLVVSISGSLFPLFVTSLMSSIYNNQFLSISFIFSIANLLFLHPSFPDGKNALDSIKEMGR
jgi:hypothetical protein